MSSPSAVQPNPSTDSAGIEAAIRDYVEGWYTGNVDRMERALHDDLVKRIPHGAEGLVEFTKTRMLELTADGGGDALNAEMEITIDDISADAATARVRSPEYLDYLHLVKTSDGWQIVNVLFQSRA